MDSSNITPGHVRVFQAIRSPFYDNITLTSCTINGERGVAIVMIDEVGEDKVAVMPLFVAITPGMKIDFLGEREFGRRRRRAKGQKRSHTARDRVGGGDAAPATIRGEGVAQATPFPGKLVTEPRLSATTIEKHGATQK